MNQSSTFQVYNASAGSGKTFTLVKQYLKILLQSSDIFQFQKILAITFTNKAAGEMKERVLKNLRAFAEGEQTDLGVIILQETGLDYIVVQERSQRILDAILKNYSAFSITTIDSFTHKIIKNFAFDLELTLNFEVEMDAQSLLNEAVDVLISKIGTDEELTNLLIDFSTSKIDDDKSWDISRELNEFSSILLNEDDVKHFRNLSDKTVADFYELKEKVSKINIQIEKSFGAIGQKGLDIIKNNNLQISDFAYSGECPKHFQKLLKFKSLKSDELKFSGRIDKNFEENKKLSAGKASEGAKRSIESIYDDLKSLYLESKGLFEKTNATYVANKLALKSIIPLAVLNKINVELDEIKEENNIRLNAEFNQLISDTIKDQPAPFIYERLGQKFMHYFIDEMQDTSVLQWQNLIPLIDNALAQENSNLLLVGDAKQAIYRWRGGRAEQFIDLGLTEVEHPFLSEKTVETLETNFRSYAEVINFNNQFFTHVSNFLNNENYKQLFIDGNQQKENSKKGGFVTVDFLEKEDDKEQDAIKYPKKILEKIKELEKQFSLSEICILVRKKKDGVAVANYLSENGIKIVSSETLLLSNSPKVNFIIDFLQIIQNPNNEQTRFEALYFLHQHLNMPENKNTFFNRFIKEDTSSFFNAFQQFGIYFDLENFRHLPFYEKIETVIRGFKLIETSDAYLQFFLDEVLGQQRKGTSIQEFLDFWNLKKDKLSIVASEDADAVQIMTIHKSKGLEFPVVIFAYDLDIYRQVNPKVWLDELPEPYEGFPELLLNYNKDLSLVNNKGAEIYQNQQEELELDNFNLLYVALTRAVEQLYIVIEKKVTKSGESLKHYSGIFINYLREKNLWDDGQLSYRFGESFRISQKETEESNSLFQESFISESWQSHQINLLPSSSKLWGTNQGEAVEYGNVFHEIMAKIKTKEDVDSVFKSLELQNMVLKEELERIKDLVLKIVNHPKLEKYFSREAIVYNERELVSNGHFFIPDRLVCVNDEFILIDYKTGEHQKKYDKQLIDYAKLLEGLRINIKQKMIVYAGNRTLVIRKVD